MATIMLAGRRRCRPAGDHSVRPRRGGGPMTLRAEFAASGRRRCPQTSHSPDRSVILPLSCRGGRVRVFVTGATGVLGMSAIAALQADGHDVTGLARTGDKADVLRGVGADACAAPLFDLNALAAALDGHHAVCNLATHIPVGISGMRRGAWKVNDRLRVEGSRIVSAAARAAGVRRLVQESVSLLYADMGDEWITESSPLSVTDAVEPSAVAESNATAFASPSRAAVVLRFGALVGDDPTTRWRIAQARAGRPIGFGDPHGWMHVVHPEDAGRAVAAAI